MNRIILTAVVLVGSVNFGAPLAASPTIQLRYWTVLGPIQNSGDCWGEIGDPPPVPGRDVLVEHPDPGEDWASSEIPFISGALTRWLNLGTELPGYAQSFTCVCFNRIYTTDFTLRLGKDRAKAVAVTYAVNRTANPIPILVCSGSYNESHSIYVNRSLVTRSISCSVDTSGRECHSLDPAVLLPGKNQITVVSYEGTNEWSLGVRLKRSDGSNIDDTTDTEVAFTNDPSGCLDLPPPAVRTVAERCSSGGTEVTLRAEASGDPSGIVRVVEDVDGAATISNVSNGGQVTTVSRVPSLCGGDPRPVGTFTDSQDIGEPCGAGKIRFDPAARSYTLTGSGSDIWDGGDQFQFAYLHARGDFSISVRIAQTPDLPPSRYGKFGIMARQDCSANSRYCALLDFSRNTDGTDPDSYDFQWRPIHGAGNFSSHAALGAPQTFDGHPEYLRMDRVGSLFTAYVAGDSALNLEKAGEFDWGGAAPCDILLGLAACSHAGCPPIDVRFDSVGYAGGDTPCLFTEARDIGAACVQGGTVFDLPSRSYTVKGGGDDIFNQSWNNGDQFHFASLKARGDFSMSVRISHRSFDPGAGQILPPSRYGKFGIMARQSEETTSRLTAILDLSLNSDGADPDSYGLEGRPVHGAGGSDFFIPGPAGIQHPAYVRLDRVGSRFIGYGSVDGSSWQKVAEQDWGVNAPCEVQLGLAVTGHAHCGSIEIRFDSVTLTGGDASCGGRIEWNVNRQALAAGLAYTIAGDHVEVPSLVRFSGQSEAAIVAGPREADLGRSDQAAPGPDFERAIDVGGATGGSTTYNPDTRVYTTVSSGDDISDAGDRFHFAYREIAGDFDLEIQILEQIEPPERGHFPAGRIGLMARKDCLGDSKHCHLEIPSAESNLIVPALVYRLIHGTNLTTIDRNQFNAAQLDFADVGQRPSYQRLVRSGNTFYAFLSRDGIAWEPLGRDTWQDQDPGEPVLVGFAAASGRRYNTNLSPPTTIKYRVVPREPLRLPPPFDDDGLAAAQTLFTDVFDTLDAAAWSVQTNDVAFRPLVNDTTRRLQLTHDNFCCPHITSAFSKAPLDGIDEQIFDFEFDGYLTRHQDNVAEGFTFTVSGGANATRLGGGPRSGTLGYDGLNRRDQVPNTNSFAVEFDCAADGEWNGGLGSPTSPGKWHLGIDSQNLSLNSHVITSQVADIYDPRGVHCRVRYNRGLVQVWVSLNDGGAPPSRPTLESSVIPISFLAPDQRAVFGFTALSGGAKVISEVDNVRVRSIPENDIPEVASLSFPQLPIVRVGETFTLDGSGSNGGPGDEPAVAAYRWQVLAGPAEILGASDGPLAQLRATGSGGPIVVMLSVDDGHGPTPPVPPALADLQLCAPTCPDPGYCVSCLAPPYQNSCVAVICPPLPAGGPEAISEVTPAQVPDSGGLQVTFSGSGFTLGSVPRLGGIPLDAPLLLGAGKITGLSPRLPLGPRAAEIVDADGGLLARLDGAVTVIPGPPPLAGDRLPPSQIEAALAEGTARFQWVSPPGAQGVVALDGAGGLLGRFAAGPGVLNLTVPPATTDKKIFLQADFGGGKVSPSVEALAKRLLCSWPPPLTGFQELGKITLPVFGGGKAGVIPRCDAPPSPFIVPDLKALGVSTIRVTNNIAGALSGAGASGGTGSVITALGRAQLASAGAALGLDLDQYLAKSVTTGFTLSSDADKLLIEAHYSMPTYRPGLRLMGRLMHVDPADNFQDEFTLPDVLPSSTREWNGIVYYRTNGDLGLSGAQPCGLKIPKGEYILQLFSAGGDPTIAHFVFSTDGLNEEILIPGVPCPPYPLVKVTDLTGKATLPVVERIDAVQLAGSNVVQFVALGYWLDEKNQPHYLTKDPPASPLPFDFHWLVHTGKVPVETDVPGSNFVPILVPQLGCYQVELTARDPNCGRELKRLLEVATEPASFTCNNPNYYSCIHPNPDPGGIFAVVGLSEAAWQGQTTAPNHVEKFRVFVVPLECCPGHADNCEPPLPAYVKFRLKLGAGDWVHAIPDGNVRDLCPYVTTGPKFFEVTVNFDQVPPIRDGGGNILQNCNHEVYLEALTVTYARPLQNPEPVSNDTWRRVSESPMLLANRPEVLLHTLWSGTHSPQDGAYQFVMQSAREFQRTFAGIQDSKPASFLIDLIPGKMPELPSQVTSGFNTALQIVNGGHFEAKEAFASLGGEVMGNLMDGSPLAKAAEAAPAIPNLDTVWEWRDQRTLFEHHFQHPIFKSILWTGVIIIIPVTIWGEMSLGFDFNVHSDIGARLAPFQAPAGGDYFQSHFDLDTSVGVSLPAQLRTDVLFGIVSYALTVHADITSIFQTHLGVRDDAPEAALRLLLKLSAGLSGEVCLTWFLCAPTPDLNFLDDTLLDYTLPLGGGVAGGGGEAEGPEVARATPAPAPHPGGGAAPRGGVALDYHEIYQTLSNPVLSVSPDGLRELSLYYLKKNQSMVAEEKVFDPVKSTIISRDITIPSGSPLNGPGPYTTAAAWLSNDRALVLSTKTYEGESSLTLPFPVGHTPAREELNELKAQEEVVLSQFDGAQEALISWFRISDPLDEVPPPGRRADGAPAIAGDPKSGEALAAWVRYETRDFLVEEASPLTYYLPPVNLGGPPQRVDAQTRVRPQMERTAIYTRRVGWGGVIDAPRKISGPGINAEPSIAFSPSGNEAVCVWLNDPTHKDLIASNRRSLVHSLWRKAGDSWSGPQGVLASPDDYPGILEPSIALKGDGEGLLAFNALPRGAEEWDSGLAGSSRAVYICRLSGGVFGPPVRVHGFCGEQIAGRYTTVLIPAPIPLPSPFKIRLPDLVVFQGTGPVGWPAASGSAQVAAIPTAATPGDPIAPAPAVSVTSPASIHSNVAGGVFAGALTALNLNGGPATLAAAAGGQASEPGYETVSVPLEPDLAVTACALSNRFPGAGDFVTARVEVENRGLAGSPTDSAGRSAVKVRIVYVRGDGAKTVEGELDLPLLDPGRSASLEFEQLEMPLDPVLLRAELSPNPVDLDHSNDGRDCFFGAPAPSEVHCAAIQLPLAGGATLDANEITWTNPALFDELSLYRDGLLLATLPGRATKFVDRFPESAGPFYEIRSRIGASRSTRASCGLAPVEAFRRGDVNDDGKVDVTDAIVALNFLFLGGEKPVCPDAVDADDSGLLDITDPIQILFFLFSGGGKPPSPGPYTCGPDPKADRLGPCGSACR